MEVLQGENTRFRSSDFFEHLSIGLVVVLEQGACVAIGIALRVAFRATDGDRHIGRKGIHRTLTDRIRYS